METKLTYAELGQIYVAVNDSISELQRSYDYMALTPLTNQRNMEITRITIEQHYKILRKLEILQESLLD